MTHLQKSGIGMTETMIAPCGMNCALCVHYQFRAYDINQKGFNRLYCPGCIDRAKGCLYMGENCTLHKTPSIRFCTSCDHYPCKQLKGLDKRYRTKYHMSMIENLEIIKTKGLDAFLKQQETKWACPTCGSPICCHNGLCLHCEVETLIKNRKYRWNEQ